VATVILSAAVWLFGQTRYSMSSSHLKLIGHSAMGIAQTGMLFEQGK